MLSETFFNDPIVLKSEINSRYVFVISNNINFGSHDDENIKDRKWFRSFGAKICEFPTTILAAKEAFSNNELVQP